MATKWPAAGTSVNPAAGSSRRSSDGRIPLDELAVPTADLPKADPAPRPIALARVLHTVAWDRLLTPGLRACR